MADGRCEVGMDSSLPAAGPGRNQAFPRLHPGVNPRLSPWAGWMARALPPLYSRAMESAAASSPAAPAAPAALTTLARRVLGPVVSGRTWRAVLYLVTSL